VSKNAQGARIYNLFPSLVGSVADWYGHLDRIAEMGFDWLYVNPFHYPGFSGSLYAVKDFYALNPLFDNGSGQAPGKQIADFAAYAEEKGISVMMDLVVNHTSKDSLLVEDHPEWFEHEHDGSLVSPGAIDPADARKKTVWADLAAIDFTERPERTAIVTYFQGMVRHFAALGIRGFRCDAAYKVPNDVWEPIIRAAREVRPDAVFVAENLGARLEEVDDMADTGFDYLYNSAKWWDFSEPWLFDQYERFRAVAPSLSFPESHDTVRLGAEFATDGVSDRIAVERGYKQAYLFCAVFSTGLLMPMGFEFGFQRKLNVVRTRPNDWEKPTFDHSEFIAEVNALKASEPVFNEEGPQTYENLGDGLFVCMLRRTNDGSRWALTVLNASLSLATTARLEGLDVDPAEGREVTPGRKGRKKPLAAGDVVTLAPGEIRVFVGEGAPAA